MKKSSLSIAMLFAFYLSAVSQIKQVYIRVFDLHGNSIAKGTLTYTTDSSIFIKKDTTALEISVTSIGYIKTRRSIGHGALTGAIVGGLAIGILGAVSSDESSSGFNVFNYSPGEGFALGLLSGGAGGALIGAFISSIKTRTKLVLNGSLNEWQKQKIIFNR